MHPPTCVHLRRLAVTIAAAGALLAFGCASPSGDAAAGSVGDDEELTSGVAAEPLGPIPSGDATRYPILLIHGFNSSAHFMGFAGVRDALARDGHFVRQADIK